MRIDWGVMLTIFLAIVLASLAEHTIIAPRMEHSPAKVLPSMSAAPNTAADFVRTNFPDAVTI